MLHSIFVSFSKNHSTQATSYFCWGLYIRSVVKTGGGRGDLSSLNVHLFSMIFGHNDDVNPYEVSFTKGKVNSMSMYIYI